MKKILAFGAHPDDVEFGCGGLLIKEIQNGNKVKVVVTSFGEAGTNGTPISRKKEATEAAKFIGAEIEFINLGEDCHIEKNTKNTIKLAEVIRKYKPNVVLATSQTHNQHPDHKNLSDMVRDASRLARYGGLKELKKYATHNIDGLYYYQSSAEIDNKPDIVVDVTGQYEMWVKAMSMHKSQMKTRGYINLVTSKARAIGASVGVEYATGLWANDPIRIESFSDFKNSSRNY
ncbi:PIG-L family deacetylase [Candidatus Nomurabacteria bacterium]|nr:PIG-L family deacetylase [Candidatus Nomurabacteria bacterium]